MKERKKKKEKKKITIVIVLTPIFTPRTYVTCFAGMVAENK